MKRIIIGIASLIALSLVACIFCIPFSFYTVNPGITAIQLRMGRVAHVHDESGLYPKMPFIDKSYI